MKFTIKSTLFVLLALLALSSFANAQCPMFGTLSDTPDHGYVVGGGYALTDNQFSFVAESGNKVASISQCTYAYYGGEVVPHLVTNTAGKRSLTFDVIPNAGMQQLIGALGKCLISVDANAGVSIAPTTDATASTNVNFALVMGGAAACEIGTHNSAPGGANNFIAIKPVFTQVLGAQSYGLAEVYVAYVRTANGTTTVSLKRKLSKKAQRAQDELDRWASAHPMPSPTPNVDVVR